MFPMQNYTNVIQVTFFPDQSVYLAQEIATKKKVELIVSNQSMVDNSQSKLVEEVKLLQKLQGIEGIPELYDYGYTSSQKFYQVLQYTGHNLFDLLKAKKQLGATTIIYLGQQLLGILERIHALNIYHTDLNPRNINILKASIYLRGFVQTNYNQSNTQYQNNTRFISKSIFNHQIPTYIDDLESLGYLLIYLVDYDLNNQIINNQISSTILFRKYFKQIIQTSKASQDQQTNYLDLKKLIYVIIYNCYNNQSKQISKKIYSPKQNRLPIKNLSIINEDEQEQIVSRNFVKINFKRETENQLDQNLEISEENCQISDMLQSLHSRTSRAKSISSFYNGLQA